VLAQQKIKGQAIRDKRPESVAFFQQRVGIFVSTTF
jgi:hypothetical protein